MEILEFIFESFWHFWGCLLLLALPCGALAHMFHREVNHYHDHTGIDDTEV